MRRWSSVRSVDSDGSSGRRVVVITGGSGALGSHIARLVYSKWDEVKEIRLFDCIPPQQALITSITGFTGSQDRAKVSYYPGDILDASSLLPACVKADVVIHCAAAVENGSVINRRKMKEVNIEGTRNVIQACLDCGVQGLLFTGTISQALTASPGVQLEIAEEQGRTVAVLKSRDLLFPYYGGTKNEAEKLVLAANSRAGKDGVVLHTCSLRCPPMFGENDTTFVLTGLKAAKQLCGYYVPVGYYTTATMQSLYFGNAAYAHVLAAQKLLDETARSLIGGKFYYIGDESPACQFVDFQTQFLKPLGYRVLPVFRIPLFLLMLLAYAVEFLVLLLAMFRVDFRSNLNRASLRYLKTSHSFSWEKAKRELDYTPLFDHQTAVSKSIEYYRALL